MIVDGLVNYWPMFNGVYDLRGNGDPIDQPLTSQVVNSFGVSNGAIHVSNNGHVQLPPDYYMIPTFTISFFLKITTFKSGLQNFVSFGIGYGCFSISYDAYGQTDVYNYISQPTYNYRISSFSINTWYHLAVTNQGQNWRVYRNGALITTFSMKPPPTAIKYSNFIGIAGIGEYSELKIYNKTLTDTEIQQDYNNYNSYLTKINL